MPTEIEQRQKKCRTCGRKTLHVRTIKVHDTGCGMHVILSVLTLGLWVPFAVLCYGLAVFANALPSRAPYLCQVCGRRN